MKYLSRIFQPLIVTPKNAKIKHHDITSKSQRLLSELGVVHATATSGSFSFLPMGCRSLGKLTALVEGRLAAAGAQRVSLPHLAPETLWARSGRLDDSEELMRVTDRHDRRYILNPTHEELITDLIASISPVTEKLLPIKLYQIGSKFRDEKRPRYGVIRCREFLMKDLYTFDIDEASAKDTYMQFGKVYDDIFNQIGVKYIKVEAATGSIGGHLSHEYHYPAGIGEDRLAECTSCGYLCSCELLTENKCNRCGSSQEHKTTMAIEVGHTFLLGTKYSEPLKATYLGGGGRSFPLHMGCYGLGLSRILGAAVEALCSETELRWPKSLAPYSLCIIGPKKGSKEEPLIGHLVESLYQRLEENCQHLKADMIIDDRTHMTIGKRVMEAKRMGYPYILVIGQKAVSENPEFELMDVSSSEIFILNQNGVVEKLQNEFDSCHCKVSSNSSKISEHILLESVVK